MDELFVEVLGEDLQRHGEVFKPISDAIKQLIYNKVKALFELDKAIAKALDEIFKESIIPATATPGEILTAYGKAIKTRLTQRAAAIDESILTVSVGLKDLTDPAKILEQVAVVKAMIEDRYQYEIEVVQAFVGEVDKLADAWQAFVDGIDQTIQDLVSSNLGPANPSEAFLMAQGRYRNAISAFYSNPSPEAAQKALDIGQQYLEAASKVFQRPSIDYQRIFDEVIGGLGDLEAYATGEKKRWWIR